ncbi:gluconokinase [Actinomadura roseirufa]|uniref:gluconokinase n=1 Tax=Actinomadura roseirufa TaxID=2094049 RepID=UPI001F5FA729|nr:gluconokinase [Actinomadura roseirufa]
MVVVAGVSGSGKTTVGRLLAERLGWEYAEADAFHSAANVAKMSAGVPLTDADRRPWLRAIAGWIDARVAAGRPGVVTCSALKRAYRDALAAGRPAVRVVLLDGDRDVIAARLRARTGHFFGADLLDSQFADLEPPAPDEKVLRVPADATPTEIATQVLTELSLTAAEGTG